MPKAHRKAREPVAMPSVAIDAEKSILGAILLDRELIEQTSELCADDFSLDGHRRLFRAMAALAEDGKAIDIVTVTDRLQSTNDLQAAGGVAYVASLTDGVPRRPSIANYVSIVRRSAGQRLARRMAEALQHQAESGADVAELAQRFADASEQIGSYRATSDISLDQFPDPLELSREPESWLVPGVILKTGITLLAGAPGEGKSWQSLAIAREVSMGGEYLGRSCERANVIVLDYENPKAVVQARWDTIFGGPVKGFVTLWAPWSGLGDPPQLGDPRLEDLARPGRLLIFDTFSACHRGADENAASEMGPVLRQLRNLANKGAALLVLHHRAKNELSRYRGSSAIAAGVDIMAALLKDDSGMLTLDVFKTRATSEFKVTFQPDYARGRFEMCDSPALTARKDEAATLAQVIGSNPGLSQNQVIAQAGLRRARAIELLNQNTGRLWTVRTGKRGSHEYFPMTGSDAGTGSGSSGQVPVPGSRLFRGGTGNRSREVDQ